MKTSNRQIAMIYSAENPVKFGRVESRGRNACRVFEKDGFSRSGQDRVSASGACRVNVSAFSSNFIPDEGIERMGTGIRDMFRRCRKAGLPEPEIRIDGGFFVSTIRRKKPEPGAQSGTKSAPSPDRATAPVTAPVGEYVMRLLVLLADRDALSNGEILDASGLKSRRRLRDTYISPALADELLERTIPDKPTSRLQKYRLTEKGRRLMEQLKKRQGHQ